MPKFLADEAPPLGLDITFTLLSFVTYSLHIFSLLSVDPSFTKISSKFLKL